MLAGCSTNKHDVLPKRAAVTEGWHGARRFRKTWRISRTTTRWVRRRRFLSWSGWSGSWGSWGPRRSRRPRFRAWPRTPGTGRLRSRSGWARWLRSRSRWTGWTPRPWGVRSGSGWARWLRSRSGRARHSSARCGSGKCHPGSLRARFEPSRRACRAAQEEPRVRRPQA